MYVRNTEPKAKTHGAHPCLNMEEDVIFLPLRYWKDVRGFHGKAGWAGFTLQKRQRENEQSSSAAERKTKEEIIAQSYLSPLN